MQTPVVFIIFKRPHTTEKVFKQIQSAKPKKLFVIADGARVDVPDEVEKCAATREIIERVDWDCEVIKNYSDINLGCGRRLPTGLDWVFEQVEEAIILEDDCVPHPTFFPFCEELLEKYRYDTRVGLISGQNVMFGKRRTDYSYYFSRYNLCWGWATWKRSWKHFDQYMHLWPEIRDAGFLYDILGDYWAVRNWKNIFQSVYENPVDDIWDYQLTFACWLQNSLTIIPNVNLISNIGFDSDSTHYTSGKISKYDNPPTEAMEFPLKHSPFVIQDVQADEFKHKNVYYGSSWSIVKRDIKKLLINASKSWKIN